MGAERIILMSRHEDRQTLGVEFGATDIVTVRGDRPALASARRLMPRSCCFCITRCPSPATARSSGEGKCESTPCTRSMKRGLAVGPCAATAASRRQGLIPAPAR
jgi:Zn-dependent alcohol dehydrogenases, class III